MRSYHPPGVLLQRINKLLHQEPFETIAHTLYWSSLLIFIAPFVGLIHVCLLPFKLLWIGTRRNIDCSTGKELGVLITGCDSGFGSDLAWELSRKGFVVFAGCLSGDGMKQFEGEKLIVPLLMDVTKLDQITAVSGLIGDWMSKGDNRILHAIVNNAGIGSFSLFDWMEDTSDSNTMSSIMDVNFYGMTHTVKSILPLLKHQFYKRSYKHARIVNVISMAGLVSGMPGCSMYMSSKFAAEAFSHTLRTELAPFQIDVVNVNPSFHKTDLVTSGSFKIRSEWKGLKPEIRQEYGEVTVEMLSNYFIKSSTSFMWERSVVTDKLVESVTLKNPPCQYIIGSDAKFVLLIMRMLPMRLVSFLIKKTSGFDKIKCQS